MNFDVPPTAPENKISPLAESLRPIEVPDIKVSPKAESLHDAAPDTEPGETTIKETMKSVQSETASPSTPPMHIEVTEISAAQSEARAKMMAASPVAKSTEEAPTDRDPELASLPPDQSPTMPSRILKI
jgi:hypothetical protein